MKDPVTIEVPVLVLPAPSILFPTAALRLSLERAQDTGEVLGKTRFKQLKPLIPNLKCEDDIVVGIFPQNAMDDARPHNIGVLAKVVVRTESIMVQGLGRIEIVDARNVETAFEQEHGAAEENSDKGDYQYAVKLDRVRVKVYDGSESIRNNKALQGRMEELKRSAQKFIQPLGASKLATMQRFFNVAQAAMAPGVFVDIFVSILPLSFADKLQVLDAVSLSERLELVIDQVRRHTKMMEEVRSKRGDWAVALRPKDKTSDNPNSSAKSNSEAGESEEAPFGQPDKAEADGLEEEDDFNRLEQTINQLRLPEEGRKIVQRELKRLKRMSPHQAEYQVSRTYLEVIAEIPWNNYDSMDLDASLLAEAREIFDADHYGLEKVKKRLLEYLAVIYLKQQQNAQLQRQQQQPAIRDSSASKDTVRAQVNQELSQVAGGELEGQSSAIERANQKTIGAKRRQDEEARANTRPPILLLVGPPGVGKTSLAKSVAHALGRKLQRISLGGVRDEAEIRGHRRTYVGAMPGVMVQGLRKAGVMNPVMVLDEIDKVGQGIAHTHGDPSAALLEVLDPEQNYSFTDHYIGFPVDLSQVLFVATANTTETIPQPLLDRMETIHIEGYTYLEKQRIAQTYLVPKQLIANGLKKGDVEIPDDVIDEIATRYTREAGVRELERQLAAVCRGKAVERIEKDDRNVSSITRSDRLTVEELPKYLGIARFHDDVVNDEVDLYETSNGASRRRHMPGVVNGLAYIGSGNGGLLVFEATVMPGKGELRLTGKLGEVISESAQIAMSWVKANLKRLGLPNDVLKDKDVHLHAPAGAIPKDGPSAGVAMTLTLVSLLQNREVPRDLALTGEMTLRGKILEVGGIREKLLGAHLAGVRKVLLPYHCQRTVVEECGFLRDTDMQVEYVKYIWDVFAQVWPGTPAIVDSRL